MVKLYAVSVILQKETKLDGLPGLIGAVRREQISSVNVLWAHNEEKAIEGGKASSISRNPSYEAISSAVMEIPEEHIREAARDLGMKD